MLRAISGTALSAAQGTEAALGAAAHLLNYAAACPGAEIICRESGMALAAGSGAACLAAPRARGRAGGCRCLASAAGTLSNGPMLALAKVTKNVMAPAAEAELGALLADAKEAVAARRAL